MVCNNFFLDTISQFDLFRVQVNLRTRRKVSLKPGENAFFSSIFSVILSFIMCIMMMYYLLYMIIKMYSGNKDRYESHSLRNDMSEHNEFKIREFNYIPSLELKLFSMPEKFIKMHKTSFLDLFTKVELDSKTFNIAQVNVDNLRSYIDIQLKIEFKNGKESVF